MRLFIALPLPSEVENYLGEIIAQIQRRDDGIKWVEPNLIHLTLRFLGETDPALLPQISRGMDSAAGGTGNIDGTLERLGAFPNFNRPRVIWLGLRESTQRMSALASAMEQLARAHGFEPESKAFKAHLTLGRVKDERKLGDFPKVAEACRIKPVGFRLDRVVLFQSTLTPAGPVYKRLHESLL